MARNSPRATGPADSYDVPQRPYLEPEHNPIGLYAEYEIKHWWFWARRKILRRIVRQLIEPGQGKVVIDVGCGPGGNIACLAADYRCYGIDISEEAIQIAALRHPQVTFIRGLAPDDLGDVLRSAEVILVMDVLEHLEDDRGFFRALFRAAPVGTTFVVTVPAEPSLWSEHDTTVGHLRRYTANDIALVWQGLDVHVRMVSPFMTFLYPVLKWQRRANQRRGRSSGAGGTDLKMPPRPLNDVLGRVFAAEGLMLGPALTRRRPSFRRGSSLLVVLDKLDPGADPAPG